MSGGFAVGAMENAKVEMYTMEGEYRCEIEIPDSTSFQIRVYFMCSDETVYVLSVNGKDYTMCMQEIPLDFDNEPEDKCESVFSDSEKISKEDWFLYQGKFYVKTGEEVYEKSDFPEAVQSVLQKEENKGSKIYEDDRIVAVDMTCGLVKAYDYDLSYMGEQQWDIEASEDMEFMDYNVEGDIRADIIFKLSLGER